MSDKNKKSNVKLDLYNGICLDLSQDEIKSVLFNNEILLKNCPNSSNHNFMDVFCIICLNTDELIISKSKEEEKESIIISVRRNPSVKANIDGHIKRGVWKAREGSGT